MKINVVSPVKPVGYGNIVHKYTPEQFQKQKLDFSQNDRFMPSMKLNTGTININQLKPSGLQHGYQVPPISMEQHNKNLEQDLRNRFLSLYDKHTKQYLPQEEKDKELTSFLKSLVGIDGGLVKRADEAARGIVRAGSHTVAEHGVGTGLTHGDIGHSPAPVVASASASSAAVPIKSLPKHGAAKFNPIPEYSMDFSQLLQKFNEAEVSDKAYLLDVYRIAPPVMQRGMFEIYYRKYQAKLKGI